MYCLVWEYQVEKPQRSAFEEHYSRNGPWFKFFEPCGDFLGHDMLRGVEESKYLIVDKWMGKAEYDSFLKVNQAEYDVLNNDSKNLYGVEKFIGAYDAL